MILADGEIRKAITKGDISITDFEEKCLQPASYDLRVGPQGFTTTEKRIVRIDQRGIFTLRPGDFGVVTSHEIVTLSKSIVARFGLKSRFSRMGLVPAIGPQIDPGFNGRLFVGLINLSPKDVVLTYQEPFCSVEFHRLAVPAMKAYDGPYQGQLELSGKDIEPLIHEGLAFSELFTELSALSKNVAELSASVNSLKWSVPIIVLVGMSVVAILVSLIVL